MGWQVAHLKVVDLLLVDALDSDGNWNLLALRKSLIVLSQPDSGSHVRDVGLAVDLQNNETNE